VNFYTGYAVSGLIVPLLLVYVIRGRYHRIAFLRNNRVTRRLVKEARGICAQLYYHAARAEAEKKRNQSKRLLKTWAFLVASFAIVVLIAALLFIGALGSVFFKSMILWKGLDLNFDFVKQISDAVKDLAALFNIPRFEYVFVPFQFMYAFFSNFKIDLSAVNLTCKGGAFQRMRA